MNQPDPYDPVVRAESLFQELLSKSSDEREEQLEGEPPEVVEQVRKLFLADEANMKSSWLDSEASQVANTIEHANSEKATADPQERRDADQSIVAPRYELLDELGSGGFGVVYSAYDVELDRQVAIKVIRTKKSPVDKWLEEARAVAKLDHENIVPVYDVGRVGRVTFLVSKLVPGKNLAQRHEDSPLTIKESVRLVAQIAAAIHEAHQRGIVHRDIKPANILVGHQKAYLCDFGLALKEDDVALVPSMSGTIQYMSPEQAKGESEFVDGRSDIYSLGVVLYECIAGRRPFKGSGSELLGHIANREVPPPRQVNDDIPVALEAICLKALANRAIDRYSTSKDLSDDLRKWLNDLEKPPETPPSAKPLQAPEFEASFHPIGAVTAVFYEMLRHPYLLIMLLPFLYTMTRSYPGGYSSSSQYSYLWLSYIPLILMAIYPIVGAAIRCSFSRFYCEQGRLVITKGLIRRTTHEIPLRDIKSVQLIQDTVGKHFGFGSLQIQGTGIYESIDGVREAEQIATSLEPILAQNHQNG